MKSGKEALVEFLRIKTPELYADNKFLQVAAEKIAEKGKEPKECSNLD